MENKNITFFLGSNTPSGFISFFDQLYNPHGDWLVYIIKGGPGTGKSGMMNKVAQAFEDKGHEVERIICASDPQSLDAVILPGINSCIADGTAPHVMEPKYPGAVETVVNLGDFWNVQKLRENASHIKTLSGVNSSFHERAVRFLSAAHSLQKDTARLTAGYIDTEKIKRYACRLSRREFGSPKGAVGLEKKRFLSAVTHEGIYLNTETLKAYCSEFYIIEDEYNVAGRYLVDLLRTYALGMGLDVISCYCPMAPEDKPEHLIIPSLGKCFFTSNSFHNHDLPVTRRIHARRFMDADGIKSHKYRFNFNRKASRELIGEAVQILQQAKGAHDQLENLYTPAMDFKKVDEKTEQLIGELEERAKTF